MRSTLIFALAGAALLAACSKPEPAAEPVRAVRTLTVSNGAAGGTREYAAEIKARTESRLGFRVGGKITRRLANVGDTVKAGQVLAQLDPQDLKLAQESARAGLSAAQTNLDLANADYKRYKDLRDQGFISSAELEPGTPRSSRPKPSSTRRARRPVCKATRPPTLRWWPMPTA